MKLKPLDIEYDFYAYDQSGWASSMANSAELVRDLIEIVEPRSIIEVGAWAGLLSQLLLHFSEPYGGKVIAIDPAPHDALPKLVASEPRLELISEMSHAGLRQIDEISELVVLDGDHNYFSVAGELGIIGERCPDDQLPAILLHDVGWPHGRRDAYEDPDNVPAEHRQPYVRGGGLHPHDDGIVPGALPMWASAERAGGPRNGVLTAAEDFAQSRAGVRLATVSPFFGLGVIWHESAPYSDALEDYLSWWESNPIIDRLEGNRVLQICTAHMHASMSEEWQRRDDRKAVLIEELLRSRAFKLALKVLGLKNRGKDLPFSEEKLRTLVAESRTEPLAGAGVR